MTDARIDELIRSKRKTIGLQITHDAKLIVRAPRGIPLYFIKNILRKKISWIQKKQKLAGTLPARPAPKRFVDGEEYLYLGGTYRLSVVDAGSTPLIFNKGFYILKNNLSRASDIFTSWYKKEAAAKIKERLDRHADLHGLKYNKFNITNAGKYWGSCTPCGTLNFSWRLIMAPLEIIDYVVAHELAHLSEKNHSKRFWEKVSTTFPGFKESRTWLRENGHRLNI